MSLVIIFTRGAPISQEIDPRLPGHTPDSDYLPQDCNLNRPTKPLGQGAFL